MAPDLAEPCGSIPGLYGELWGAALPSVTPTLSCLGASPLARCSFHPQYPVFQDVVLEVIAHYKVPKTLANPFLINSDLDQWWLEGACVERGPTFSTQPSYSGSVPILHVAQGRKPAWRWAISTLGYKRAHEHPHL